MKYIILLVLIFSGCVTSIEDEPEVVKTVEEKTVITVTYNCLTSRPLYLAQIRGTLTSLEGVYYNSVETCQENNPWINNDGSPAEIDCIMIEPEYDCELDKIDTIVDGEREL